MGWCHEFGPQIVESCEHPMTAGPSSCSCERCGTVCTGRFGGCAAVWDRAPGHVVPAPADSVPSSALSDVGAPAPAPAPEQAAPSPGVLDGSEPPELNGTEMSAVLAHLFQRVESLESRPVRPEAHDDAVTEMSAVLAHLCERVESLERAPVRSEPFHDAGAVPHAAALAAAVEKVERLATELGRLDELSGRLEALEHAGALPPSPPAEGESLEELVGQTADQLDRHRARTIERLDELGASVDTLTKLPERVSALEWVGDDTHAVKEALTELGRGLDRLTTESQRLVAIPQRVAVLEQAAAAAADALERQLSGIEKSVTGVGGAVEQLAERVTHLSDVPRRVEALERAAFGGGPVHARSRSIVADVDALQTQVEDMADAVEGVPGRLATVERSMARTEALERGLAGAIDMIDQLVVQLAALEWAYRPLPPPDEEG